MANVCTTIRIIYIVWGGKTFYNIKIDLKFILYIAKTI